MTRALLQQALDALTTRDVRLHESAAEAIRAELAKPEQPAQEPNMKLFSDCKTDKEKSNFFLSGRGYETGVVAKSIQNDVAMAYHRLSLLQPAQEPLSNDFLEILEAVRRELDDGDTAGNAPGHCHDVPGIWDSDNGKKAGKPCAWCATWKKFTGLIDAEKASGIGGKA